MPANQSLRRARLGAALALAAFCSFAPASSSAAAPVAHAAENCPLPHYPGVGYFTSLTASGTTCATGKKVAIAYYRCRIAHGGVRGRCRGGVLGFKCSEVRDSIPTEIDARVTCIKADAKVVHTYQQDIAGSS